MSAAPDIFDVTDLGRMAYLETLERQREINRAVSTDARRDTVLLVEHEPVVTVSHRRDAAEHLLGSPIQLRRLGITVCETDRGGDITYHGPGQLVAYPIVRLGRYGLNLGRYMRLLERVAIGTAAGFGVEAMRDPGATGVWVARPRPHAGLRTLVARGGVVQAEPEAPADATELAKLCALGVRIRKNTTMHGLALNVNTNLAHFTTIDPCGLGQRPVTSLRELLGERCPPMDAVKAALVDHLGAALAASRQARDPSAAGG